MPRPVKDLSLARFGRLFVQYRHGSTARAKLATWNCLCDCGTEVIKVGADLRKGTQSCGCLNLESNTSGRVKHGQSGRRITREYKAWVGMRHRCRNPRSSLWLDYGGRGISVCDEWDDFERFLLDMGKAPQGKTLDRIDNDLGYGPDNCRWASLSQQNSNRRPTGFGRRARRAALLYEARDL
jgi:hypothetical protein